MPWPVHPTGFFGARGDNDSYRIERSLRFNSADSAYLNRTPASAGNRKTWTWSGWVKRSGLGVNYHSIFGCDNGGGQSNGLFFDVNNTLWFYRGSINYRITSQVFRDVSAWYHIVLALDTTQATANNRVRLYVNGSEVTNFSTINNPTQNEDLAWNNNVAHGIGADIPTTGARNYFSGYLTEINFIDGQALTPSSFGETDPITGRWKAKAYSGTYGTNGFYLKFDDNSGTTATTLGKDSSGNGNNWTPNNFSVTAGAGNDSLVDSPTNYGTDTGVGGEVRGNYATLNPLTGNSTLVDGNLRPSTTGAGISTIGMSSGKWYCEMNVVALGSAADFGVHTGVSFNNLVGSTASGYSYYDTGQKNNNNSPSAYGASYTTGDVIGCAFDADLGQLTFYKNGVSQGIAFSGLTSGPYFFAAYGRSIATANNVYLNFGQRPFAYAAPSGFKALCTTNLPQPTIQKPSKYMDVVAYTGTGASNSISSLGFSPDLVWIKNRGTTTSHAIYDTTRGSQNQLSSDTTGDAVTSSTGLTAFGSNGFTVGTSSLVNTSGTQYVAWSWDEAPIAGMDIVSYTGNGANRTISHNLGVAPKMLVVKARTTAGADQGWPIYHSSLANTQYILLNSTAAAATGADYWNSTTPTSSVFSVGTNVAVNALNDTYISYLFSEVEGFSKFGSWSGNASTDGPFIWCGFRPKYVLAKRDAAGKPWMVYDSGRSDRNSNSLELRPNTNEIENASLSGEIDFLSSGFKIRSDSGKWIGELGTFIFAAFAESPFKYARAR